MIQVCAISIKTETFADLKLEVIFLCQNSWLKMSAKTS